MASSQFTKGEVLQILIAWIVLSVALSFFYIFNVFNYYAILAVFIATATGFILHEMAHKFVAIRHGYVAHFRVWTWGLVLTLLTAVASEGRLLFGAPGAVYIAPAAAAGYYGYGYYSSNQQMRDPDYENMIISAAGPGTNLMFALLFLGLLFVATIEGQSINSFLYIVGIEGFALNVGLGSFNMLPIPPMDGFKVFKKNIAVALAIAIPLWAMFLYFFVLAQ
jgi:Zn-dependent protease